MSEVLVLKNDMEVDTEELRVTVMGREFSVEKVDHYETTAGELINACAALGMHMLLERPMWGYDNTDPFVFTTGRPGAPSAINTRIEFHPIIPGSYPEKRAKQPQNCN